MNRNKLKTYAPQARRDFIAAVTDRAGKLGITAGKGKVHIDAVQVKGDVALIGDRPYPRQVAAQRRKLEERIHRHGFERVMEAMAYTWFNRLIAIRFMEVNGYLDHGYRVLSHPLGKGSPEILEQAEHVDLPGLDKGRVIDFKLAGNRDEELYRQLLIAQCNALSAAMPFLFERIDDETELLLPDNLLHSDSVIRRLVTVIPEEDWHQIEIVGWLYQFYISEKKDQVIGKVVKSEDIPAATQLFTPNWIVKYLLHNSLGRQWLATYPDSAIKGQMEYYIEPAEQSEEVQRQLAEITPQSLDPEAITVLDPACGSGHILVEAYELMKAIYQERGYRSRDVPALILTENLYGLEIDDRAAQLAAFALMMKAKADDRRIFEREVRPNVLAIQESRGLDGEDLGLRLGIVHHRDTETQRKDRDFFGSESLCLGGADDITELLKLFEHGKTFGSLITVPQGLAERLPALRKRVEVGLQGDMLAQEAARTLLPFVQQALFLAAKYDVVVANPPYMGSKGMNSLLKNFSKRYPTTKVDLFAMFIERGFDLAKLEGYNAMVTMQHWMFLTSYKALREYLLTKRTIIVLAHLGARAFSEISGEVVQTTAFVLLNRRLFKWKPSFFRLVKGSDKSNRQALRDGLNRFNLTIQDNFTKVPNYSLAYWISNYDIFNNKKLGEIAFSGGRTKTHNDENYVRVLWEVSSEKVGSKKKWHHFEKGGDSRKWYGSKVYIVNWSETARTYYSSRGGLSNQMFWAKEGVSWSDIASGMIGFRYKESDTEYSSLSPTIFFEDFKCNYLVLSLLNSIVADYFFKIINPTFHLNVGDTLKLPIINLNKNISCSVIELIEIAKNDWNSFETSWDFQSFPWLTAPLKAETTEQSWRNWETHCRAQIKRMQELETENNRLFIEAYGLQDELTSDVPEDQITLARPDREADVKRLISYAIGCMMGRYRLDKPGLIYAHSGNKNFDRIYYQGDTEAQSNNPSKNSSVSLCLCGEDFFPDQDGIIPLTEIDWFEEDAVNRRKLEKERDALLKQQAELSAFDDKLRHYADQRIALDLDDGVKKNYGKFGELLAESKAVTGN